MLFIIPFFCFSNSLISVFSSVNSVLLLFSKNKLYCSIILSQIFVSLILILSWVSLYIQINEEKKAPKSAAVPEAVGCLRPLHPRSGSPRLPDQECGVDREVNFREGLVG